MFVNWIGTLAGGVLRMRAPMIFALASISTLSFGLIGELIQSVIPVNWLLADTTASTAATGYVFVGGPVLGGLAALSYWFPKMTGRTMGEGLARASVALIVLGAQLTFIPMFLAGVEGQQVEIFKYFAASDAINAQHLDALNLIATIGAFVLSLGVVISIANAYLSVKRGVPRRARPLGWRDARVVRDLASAASQLRRRSRRAKRRAAARHPRGGTSAATPPRPARTKTGEPVA